MLEKTSNNKIIKNDFSGIISFDHNKQICIYVFCTGGGSLFFITKRAMMKKDYKELDESIKAKVTPFLYNNGEGALIPIAQMSCIRNRDRSKKKWVSMPTNSKYYINLQLIKNFFLVAMHSTIE